jgi:hypothetical protein
MESTTQRDVTPVPGTVTDPVYDTEEAFQAELRKRMQKPEQQQLEASPEQRAKHIWEDPRDADTALVGGIDEQVALQERNAKKAGKPVEEREQIKEEAADRKQELKDQKAKEEQEAIDRRNRGEPEPALAEDQKPLEQREAEEKERQHQAGLQAAIPANATAQPAAAQGQQSSDGKNEPTAKQVLNI